MKINVIYNKYIPKYEKTLIEVEKVLKKADFDYKTFDLEYMMEDGEFTLVIGGDGTLLRAAKFYSKNKIPVMGINTGRLGFLSQADMKDLDSLPDIIKQRKYYTEERLMLISNEKLALNDFVIKGCNPSRTSKFYLDINENCVCDYIADGLIVATPTGTTAYGLSAGGPILSPTVNAITIVPICPHTLNARPLVIPSSETITIRTADKLLTLICDGYEASDCVENITIKSTDKKALLAFTHKEQFYSVLRNKLHWGISPEGGVSI